MADYMVLTAIFLGALYWALESLLNVFSPEEISFYQEIFGPNISVVWPRLIVFCLFLIFGSHVQFTVNERKRAVEALRESEEKYRTILESIEEGYYEALQTAKRQLDGVTIVDETLPRSAPSTAAWRPR